MISRRTFLKLGGVFSAAFMIEGFAVEPRRFRVEKIAVGIAGLPPEFNGFKICQITDVHHSLMVGLGYISSVVEAANALKPDLTALTGDYVDEESKYIRPAMKCLAGLRARCGVVSILGNHDNAVDRPLSRKAHEENNIPLLENEHRLIAQGGGTICIAGVKDYLEDIPDARVALKGVDESTPRILLAHHPDYCEHLPRDTRIDFIISGHTHGGQVRLPFGIAPVIPSEFGQKYAGGLVDLKRPEGTRVYVSRGIGTVFLPVRFNCPPELTLITLKPSGQASSPSV